MSSLSPKDRVSLCSFTFSDGRRCRSPRFGNHPRFCPDHAQKEARARARQNLGKDLAHYFSGDYLSACDLSTALGCLIPAVIRGDVKPRTARTVAYLAQTLMQAIHISQDEYINTFGTDGWRKSIRNSVNGNHNYRFPPAPEPQQSESPQPQPATAPQPEHPGQPQPQPQPASPPTQAHQPAATPTSCHSEPAPQSAPSPHTPMPPTSTEFAQHVLAGQQTGGTAIPGCAPQMTATKNPSGKASPPKPTSANGHSERSDERPTRGASPESYREESASSSSPAQPPTSVHAPQPPASHSNLAASTTAKTPHNPAAQPAPTAHSFTSEALPHHVRRRLHRTEDSHLL